MARATATLGEVEYTAQFNDIMFEEMIMLCGCPLPETQELRERYWNPRFAVRCERDGVRRSLEVAYLNGLSQRFEQRPLAGTDATRAAFREAIAALSDDDASVPADGDAWAASGKPSFDRPMH